MMNLKNIKNKKMEDIKDELYFFITLFFIQLTLIILKLSGVISFGWGKVLIPINIIIIPMAIFLGLWLVLCFLFVLSLIPITFVLKMNKKI